MEILYTDENFYLVRPVDPAAAKRLRAGDENVHRLGPQEGGVRQVGAAGEDGQRPIVLQGDPLEGHLHLAIVIAGAPPTACGPGTRSS